MPWMAPSCRRWIDGLIPNLRAVNLCCGGIKPRLVRRVNGIISRPVCESTRSGFFPVMAISSSVLLLHKTCPNGAFGGVAIRIETMLSA